MAQCQKHRGPDDAGLFLPEHGGPLPTPACPSSSSTWPGGHRHHGKIRFRCTLPLSANGELYNTCESSQELLGAVAFKVPDFQRHRKSYWPVMEFDLTL